MSTTVWSQCQLCFLFLRTHCLCFSWTIMIYLLAVSGTKQPKAGGNVTNWLRFHFYMYFPTIHIGICRTLLILTPRIPDPQLLGPCISLYIFKHFVQSREALGYPPLSNLGTAAKQSSLIEVTSLIIPSHLIPQSTFVGCGLGLLVTHSHS